MSGNHTPRPRRRLARAAISALAGGGLTAAGLAGPLTGGALGASAPAGADGTAAHRVSGAATANRAEQPDPTQLGTSAAAGSTTDTSTQAQSTATSEAVTTQPAPSATPGTDQAAVAGGQPDVAQPAPAPQVTLQRSQQPSPAQGQRLRIGRANHPAARRQRQQRKQRARRSRSKGPVRRRSSAPSSRPAISPQLAGQQLTALTAAMALSGASARTLSFYRIPLFLLPIYRAAGARYGVPWPVLAAINEVETDYGNDLSVSSAGAVGWMQFMPATWRQYGVDASGSGFADPYNPLDAIFAAARYLHDMGATHDLRGAIFAYNHSETYVQSVILRAKLVSRYPRAVVTTLGDLANGGLPITGSHVAWGPLRRHSATATGHARAVRPLASIAATALTATRLADVHGARNAKVVAVRAGRVVAIGTSRKLGKYVILRDRDGDIFTYSGLGSFARSTRLRQGSKLAKGAVLGRVRNPPHARDGHLRFAISPAGDPQAVDPRPILRSWAQLSATLHHPLAGGVVANVLDIAPRGTKPHRRHSPTRPRPLIVARGSLSPSQWNQLIAHIGTLHAPAVTLKPSSWAVSDRNGAIQPLGKVRLAAKGEGRWSASR